MTTPRRIVFALALAALPAACGSPPPPPAVLELQIAAGADQNPDAAGKPAPVAIQIFQLTGTAKFERADVFALTEREQATLGADSAGSEQFALRPGESRTISRQLKPGVQALGVAVLFRDIDRAQWRAMAPLAPSGPTRLRLATTGTTAKLGPAPP